MSAKFEIKKSKNDKFLFNLKAGNGEVILTSEIYEAKASALAGIESVRTNAPNDQRYERKTSDKNEPFFVLKASNGQVGRAERDVFVGRRNGGRHRIGEEQCSDRDGCRSDCLTCGLDRSASGDRGVRAVGRLADFSL